MFDASEIKVVILDFDGVIVESNDIKDRAFEKIFNSYPEYSEDFFRYHKKHVSVSRYTKFDYVLEKLGRVGDMDLKNKLLADFSKYTLELMYSAPFVKGAKEFLAAMQDKLPLYLASVTPIDDLNHILRHLNIRPFFTDVYGCPPWTKPGAILDIVNKENQTASSAVLIGDSYGDQRAANETGIHFIGRNSGLGFEDPQPACIIPDLTSLSTIFKTVHT